MYRKLLKSSTNKKSVQRNKSSSQASNIIAVIVDECELKQKLPLMEISQNLVVWRKSLKAILTLSHIQQICSRLLWKNLGKNIENLYKSRYTYWIELKTLCQKEILLVLSNFFFCHKVFKSYLLQRPQKASTWGKG